MRNGRLRLSRAEKSARNASEGTDAARSGRKEREWKRRRRDRGG
ncbi:hypothetical protein GWI33_007041, partial [Rhynchophorus ferrugineus]